MFAICTLANVIFYDIMGRMATKTRGKTKGVKTRARKVERKSKKSESEFLYSLPSNMSSTPVRSESGLGASLLSRLPQITVSRKWVWGVGVAALVVLWWWRTDSWPVIAMVDGSPIFRYQVERQLFAQGGKSVLDSLVTQKLIEKALDEKKVQADAGKVEDRIAQIKSSLNPGETWEDALARQGMTEAGVRDIITLQSRIETAVSGEASVSAEEIDKYVKDNGQFLTGKTNDEKRKEAEDALKQSKLAEAVDAWVTKVRDDGETKVWRAV